MILNNSCLKKKISAGAFATWPTGSISWKVRGRGAMILNKAHERTVFKLVLCTLSGIFFFLLCFCPSAGIAKKLSSDLLSVSFPTEQEGFVCGRRGVILHTSDGGATWIPQQSGTKRTLTGIYFIDDQNGWAVGGIGTILNTKDGGKTWTQQKSPVDDFLMNVQFVNRQKGWIVGERTSILYTEDGGSTWRLQFKDEDFVLKGVSFCDDQNGWAVGEFGYIYHTQNGGKTWIKQAGEFRFSEETGEIEGGTFLFNVLALDPKTAWVVGIDGYVAFTKDGGKSWQNLIKKGIPKTQLFSITTDSSEKGGLYIAGTGVLLVSFDKGNTFKEAKTEPPVMYGWLYNVKPRGKAGLVAVGKNGWIYLSDLQGEVWSLAGQLTEKAKMQTPVERAR